MESGIPTVAARVQPIEMQSKTIEGAKLKDLKAKNYLFQTIDRKIMERILNYETKDIWGHDGEKILRIHEGEKSSIASSPEEV